jgi:uncharacterized membrane protein
VEFIVWPGAFVVEGQPVARLSRKSSDAAKTVARAVSIGSHRTPLEDPIFLIDQLVEVALRALSPGINDPFTAFSCIDYLSAALSRLASRRTPSPEREDDKGSVRVVAWGENFETATDAAFNQIRHAAAGKPAVLGRLISALDSIAGRASNSNQWNVLSFHLSQLKQCVAAVDDQADRRKLELSAERLQERIAKACAGETASA